MAIDTLIPPVINGVGIGLVTPGKAVDKRAEVVSGGSGFGLTSLANTVQLLYRNNDEAQRRFGDRVYDFMSRDPIAGGSVNVLKYSTLANELTVTPRVSAPPGRKPDDPDLVDRCARAADRARWCLERLETPLNITRFEMMDYLKYGSSLAEIVWEIQPDGPYAGQLVPKAIKPKARTAWMFAVDAYYNVHGIVAAAPSTIGWQLLPREKFIINTWGGRGGDPRGTSIYSMATESWNFRVQLPAEHFKFCKRFGSPVPVGTLGPEASLYDQAGVEITPEANFLTSVLGIQNGKGMVKPSGYELELLEPKSKGEVFTAALDYYRREMILGILLQARVTMEAANGSKADSETSENVLDNIIGFIRGQDCRSIEWQLLYRISLYNDGKQAADETTPRLDGGKVSKQDVAAMLTSLASLGYKLDASQFPQLDQDHNLPVRDLVEVVDGQANEEIDPNQSASGPSQEPTPAKNVDTTDNGKQAA